MLIAAAVVCAALAQLKLPDATITAAEEIAAGDYTPPGAGRLANLPSFCRVALTVTPQIRIEVWLPKEWNGRFRGEGGGGYAGVISYAGLAEGIRAGYATASTDTGHPASAGGSFVLNPDRTLNMDAVRDFAERSLRELAVKSKAVVNAYYDKAPQYSYWNGCSTGGRQGLMAAQRFPEEYDGMVIGAPAINWDRFIPAELWPKVVMNTGGGVTLSPAKLAALTKATVAQCDAADGVTDGLIGNPRKCNFDPGVLVCRPADDHAATCLTADEADAIRNIWKGPTSASGQRLWFGLERGAPLNFLAGANPFPIASDHEKYWVRQDPSFDWHTLTIEQFAADFAESRKKLHDAIGTDDPKLDAFRTHGGRMIIWHGEADPLIMPRGTIDYYERVIKANGGAKKVADFARLFMAPGVGHCAGGDGPNPAGLFDDIVQWVEKHTPPATVLATKKRPDGTTMNRPLCPYPTTAKWKGTGSTDEAANFVCTP